MLDVVPVASGADDEPGEPGKVRQGDLHPRVAAPYLPGEPDARAARDLEHELALVEPGGQLPRDGEPGAAIGRQRLDPHADRGRLACGQEAAEEESSPPEHEVARIVASPGDRQRDSDPRSTSSAVPLPDGGFQIRPVGW